MKDPASHMTKFLRKYNSEEPKENSITDPLIAKEFAKEKSVSQVKKQQKIKRRQKHEAHIPVPKTAKQRNKELKNKTSIFTEIYNPTHLKEEFHN